MTSKVKLFRYSDDGKVTLGNLAVITDGITTFQCVTDELPWLNNQQQVSCIPAGVYKCRKVKNSPAFKYEHIAVLNVTGRAGIKIHIANYVHQLRGCIAPGVKHADIDGDGVIDVTSSGDTLRKLLAALPDSFYMEIYAP